MTDSKDLDSNSIFKKEEVKQLKEILQILFKHDYEFYTKLRNILTTNFINYFTELMEKIKIEIYKQNPSQLNSKFYIEK